ncbi:sodium/bile acid cotransporter 7 [Trueperella bonasi]|uniref:Sodium/bile acid cotransporter 7 n=1 Tax=Trueperella bonasi TaxID=312286 RepID=A0ABT9NDN7_9ACTO|nr:bile acid:sodium symporter family protein [Trueperella bonasi]MDP9805494.1 sodium/bile acid cotransporter 7 [Trueperella bonasi]
MALNAKELLKRIRPDFLLTGIITALILGLFVPVPENVAEGFSTAADVGVGLVFLVYGMRLRTSEVIAGLRNIKLQTAVLATTYVFFPLLGFAFYWLTGSIIGAAFATGLLYLSLLPSTVQSSVTFVSIARGDVASAVCSATISNILGMFLTPVLVLVFMDMDHASTGGIQSVLVKLLLPFIIGQMLQPFVGNWVRAHRNITKFTDNSAIILVVFSAVVKATNDGAWSSVTAGGFFVLLLVLSVLLGIVLLVTWYGGKLLGFPRGEKIVLLMCGSKKSLATGLPMAKALFDPAIVGAVAVPVIIFHQLQLIVAAVIARRLGAQEQ